MAAGTGVTVSKRVKKLKRGKTRKVWVVRWREPSKNASSGETSLLSKQKTCSTEEAAIELRALVLKTLEAGQLFEPEVREVVEVASFFDIGAAWLKNKSRKAPATRRRYASSIQKFADVVRYVRGIREDEPIPATILSEALIDEVAAELKSETTTRVTVSRRKLRNGEVQLRRNIAKPCSDSDLYATIQRALAAWALAHRRKQPGVPTPPLLRDLESIEPPIYEAGDAPEMEHCDAALRQLARSRRAYVALAAGVIMRWTGLRVSQAQSLRWDHLNRETRTLTIPAESGKSRREKSRTRTIPIAAGLIIDLDRLGRFRSPDSEWIVPRRRDREVGPKEGSSPVNTLRRAWERATEQDGVPRQVWDPTDRMLARPDHAFRSALQAHLDSHRVRESAIDALVGHAPASTRRKHYAKVKMEELRDAVDLLPETDWKDVDWGQGTNVVEGNFG